LASPSQCSASATSQPSSIAAEQNAIELERGGGLGGRAVDDLADRAGVGQAPDGGADALEGRQPRDGALVDELAVQPAQLGVLGVGIEGCREGTVGGEDVLGAALQCPGHAFAQLPAHRACLTSSR
jgi:hypothetical protein